jgi:hypothetical protein
VLIIFKLFILMAAEQIISNIEETF